MPNILLTNYCNRNCPYCFAKERVYLDTHTPRWEMPEEDFRVILTYLKPGLDPVSLLGGEPTLHSRFHEIVALALQTGHFVKIFTNGVSPVLRRLLGKMDTHTLAVILNLNPPGTYSESEKAEIEANCRAFGPNLQLSFNIYKPDFSWDFLRADHPEVWLKAHHSPGHNPTHSRHHEYLLERKRSAPNVWQNRHHG